VAPLLPEAIVANTTARLSSFDAGRGCPFQCSFCTIINVQGRKSRWRDADDIEKLIRANHAPGYHIVLHHRRQFRPQQELGADLRPDHRAARERTASDIHFLIQVDTLAHASELYRKGGARRMHAMSSSAWRASIRKISPT
jgi:hypothetical protein